MDKYLNRDISWLGFNARVLQEAADPRVPLYERIKFLAIYSSNLDEFFRVRVAGLRQFRGLKKSTRKEMAVKPKRELKEIRAIVQKQQQQFGRIFRQEIIPELRRQGIHLLDAEDFSPAQKAFARKFGEQEILPVVKVHRLGKDPEKPFLANKGLYFVVAFPDKDPLGLVEIPSTKLPRFHLLPGPMGQHHIAFLDDLLRFNLEKIFGQKVEDAYAIKMSRDADLRIEDEYDGDLLAKIKHGLENRNIGLPTRFLYDGRMPLPLLNRLVETFELEEEDLARGARYHNFNDLFAFPDPLDKPAFHDPPMPPLPQTELEKAVNLFDAIREKDRLLHFPYQSYHYIPRWIREAAEDEKVKAVKISLYRIASGSEIVAALLYALEKGKKVMAFVEAKARFDESSNLNYGARLKEAGAEVYYSYPAVKVHAKILLFLREEKRTLRFYAYIGTGNFNEKTARLYADHALLTADPRLSGDVERVFSLLERRVILPGCKHLMVSPFTLRQRFTALIDREIALARQGREAYLLLKMNSLQDEAMVDKLYEASQAGVHVRLMVRGICCLIPGVPGLSENIEAISIVDRFLEHARLYVFGNGDKEEMYIASADWMTRNLDRRVEVAAPILDPEVYAELRRILDIQWSDTCKARRILPDQTFAYREEVPCRRRSQTEIYQMLKTARDSAPEIPSEVEGNRS